MAAELPCAQFLLSRRSVRRFKPDPVPLDLVLRALDLARHAPSAHNRQPWEFVVVRDRGRIEELSRIHEWSSPVARAPLAIVVLADTRQAPDSYMQDGAIVATYLWLALHCVGLATVWIYTLNKAEEIRRIIRAPDPPVSRGHLPGGLPGGRAQAQAQEGAEGARQPRRLRGQAARLDLEAQAAHELPEGVACRHDEEHHERGLQELPQEGCGADDRAVEGEGG